jgi:hypothetical protein
MDTRPDQPFFCDPRPDAASADVIDRGLRRMDAVAPGLDALRARLGHPSAPGCRELFLDAAAVLLAEADRQWTRGRVLEALALEGLEARLLEQIVSP